MLTHVLGLKVVLRVAVLPQQPWVFCFLRRCLSRYPKLFSKLRQHECLVPSLVLKIDEDHFLKLTKEVLHVSFAHLLRVLFRPLHHALADSGEHERGHKQHNEPHDDHENFFAHWDRRALLRSPRRKRDVVDPSADEEHAGDDFAAHGTP